MSKITVSHFSRYSCPGKRILKKITLCILAIFAIFAFCVAPYPAAAQESKEDQYFRVYTLIQQADSLIKNGQTNLALTKYKQAQTSLNSFQKTYPDWNAKVVAFRSNYVAQKVSALAQASALAADGAKAESGGTQVKLLEAGTEPRKVLRLHPKEGDKQSIIMTMKMAMDMKMGEMQNPPMKLPVMKMTMDATVKSISPDGDISYDIVLSDATIVEDSDVVPQVAEAMKKSIAGVKGLTGNGIISSRGLNKSSDIKVPAGVDPQARQTIEQLKDSVSKITTPLPEEAVGPGAKWQAKMPVKSQGMVIDQTITYELVSIEDERITTRLQLEQHAANQKVQNPSMPNVKLDLVKMTGNGTGTATLDQSRIVPAEGTLDTHSELSMSMNAGGQKQAMTMKVDLNLQIEGK